jgi:hypothetical protein
VEQRTAMDAEPVRADDVVAEVEQRPAGRVRAAQAPHPRARDTHAEPLEYGHAGRLQQDPGTHRPRLGGLLEQHDLVPVAGEEDRRGAARRPRPDHSDPHGRSSSPL